MKKNVMVLMAAGILAVGMATGCTSSQQASSSASASASASASSENSDQAAADHVAELIDAIYVQERTDDTDKQCEEAKAAWDALTDAQKALVEGENEILVVSFGTSFNDSRATDIGGIEKAVAAAYPDWSVRRAFTAQIIINHVQARDGEKSTIWIKRLKEL